MKNQHISLDDQIQETSNGEDEEIQAKAVDAEESLSLLERMKRCSILLKWSKTNDIAFSQKRSESVQLPK